MAFSSGVFSRLYSFVTDRNAGTKILAARMDAEMDGFATGLSQCVLKDGTQTITAHIPMSGFKITGLGNASADTDALNRVTADARYQPLDADLTAIAALSSAANKLPYATGSGAWALADLTAAGRAILDDADASAQRTTLGLGSLATASTVAYTSVDTIPQDRILGRVSSGVGAAEALTLGTGLSVTGSRLDSGGWTQISSVSPTGIGDGLALDFTSIDSRYNELLLVASAVSTNGGSSQPRLRYSTNNGSGWTTWITLGTMGAAGDTSAFSFRIQELKVLLPVVEATSPTSSTGVVSSGYSSSARIIGLGSAINALRLDIDGSVYFDAGTVTLFGR